jgi:hypothetical protein
MMRNFSKTIWFGLLLLPLLLAWGGQQGATAVDAAVAEPTPPTPTTFPFVLGPKPPLSANATPWAGRTADEQNSIPPNCRYGVADIGAPEFIPDLGAGWVVNFVADQYNTYPAGVDYVPIIRLKQARGALGERVNNYVITAGGGLNDGSNGLGQRVANNPGRLWLIGNEVDRPILQDDLMPDVYAMAYHDIYHFIKKRDPSARIGISGLVQVSPGRLQYLDLMWNAYIARYGHAMPVDVWNMHIYPLSEKNGDGSDSGGGIALGTDPNIALISSGGSNLLCHLPQFLCYHEHDSMTQVQYQVTAMRQWMKNRGQQQKPLIISEYGILWPYIPAEGGDCEFLKDELGNCFDPQRVRQFMINTFNYFQTAADPNLGYALDNNKLVQQWLWYPSFVRDAEELASSSKLVNLEATGLTLMGQTFANGAASNQHANLIVERVTSPAVSSPTGTATIRVIIRNNGNKATTQPVTLNFFNQSNNFIGSAVVPAGLGACAMYSATGTFSWTGLTTGKHPFTVQISSAEDTNPNDNQGSGVVWMNPDHQVWLPVLSSHASPVNLGLPIMPNP